MATLLYWIPLLAGVAFFVFGIRLVIKARYWKTVAEQSRSWPTVLVRVVDVSYTSVARPGTDGKQYALSFKLSYTVDGRTFNPTYQEYVQTEEELRQILAQYSTGGSVKVAYDPRRPEVCVLRPQKAVRYTPDTQTLTAVDAAQTQGDFNGALAVAALFFMIGLVALVIGIAGLMGWYLRPVPT